ncbi:MAG: sialidase family protein [Chloroflexota bacterium]
MDAAVDRDLRDPSWPDYGWIEDVAGVPDGILLTRASADGELFASPGGSAWESMGPLPPGYTDLGSGLVTSDGRVVVSFEAREPIGHVLEAWLRSPDGTWVRSLREPSTAQDGLVATGSLVVLAATGYDAGAETWPRLFVSTDGGATWDPGLSWSGPRGGCARDLATDGTRLVLLGCDEGVPTLWHADVPDAGAGASPAVA